MPCRFSIAATWAEPFATDYWSQRLARRILYLSDELSVFAGPYSGGYIGNF